MKNSRASLTMAVRKIVMGEYDWDGDTASKWMKRLLNNDDFTCIEEDGVGTLGVMSVELTGR